MPNLFLDLAERGARFPVGTDLVLHEKPDSADILLDGVRLGEVCLEAARRYGCPVALPLMDLKVEKEDLLTGFMGIGAEDAATAHLDAAPSDATIAGVTREKPLSPRARATAEAVRRVADEGREVPCGMAIGPFSLTTKLMATPIEPVFMSGMGMSGEDDEEVEMLEQTLKLAEAAIRRTLYAQIDAGARVVFICEPAANIAYFSPNQIAEGSDVFQRLVIEPNRRLIEEVHAQGVQVIFHDCGELVPAMVESFTQLRPELLSLGSSRTLAEDAALLPKEIVLYGNLPSKRFYSDSLCSVDEVVEQTRRLVSEMRQTGHPFILGTECDVLSVPGSEEAIKAKVDALLRA
ncbi:MAG: hypothetical protein MH204_06630 [Fimbriimonadaceae bacterium]|nr:hypothetical protein [Fimbriimonadaceae bacterium]